MTNWREADQQVSAQVLDGSLDAYVAINDRGEVVMWNKSAELMFGWTREEAIGQRIADLFIPEEFRARHLAAFGGYDGAIADSPIVGKITEQTAKHRYGRHFPVELTVTVTETDLGRVFHSFLRDITTRRAAETELRSQLAWQAHISRAVANKRLLIYAQPIIDLRTGDLWGEEWLVRMKGERTPGEVVEPSEFLPQAERFGLMPVIDEFMIGAAVEQAAGGRKIAVNVSANSVQSSSFCERMHDRLSRTPAAAENLVFEITETAALASPGVAERFSAKLTEIGAGLALDDFGTGYGSLVELRHLNLHSLKIDCSFVRNLANSEEDQRLVKLIVHIAQEFGITTTAEGVEGAATLDLLREFGVDRAQGFFIGRPAPAVRGYSN